MHLRSQRLLDTAAYLTPAMLVATASWCWRTDAAVLAWRAGVMRTGRPS